MSGRRLAIVLAALALAAGAWRWETVRDRVNANATAAYSERVLGAAIKKFGGALPRRLLEDELARLGRARKLDPAGVEVLVSQAGFLFMLSRHDAAEKVYLEALALQKRSEVYANLARLYMQQNRPQDALEPLRKAMAIDPQLTPTLTPMVEYAKKAIEANAAAEKARQEREALGASAPAVPESSENAGLLFSEDFESGNLEHWWRVDSGGSVSS